MAHLYINSALLVAATMFIKEQLWLQNKEDKKNGVETLYKDFLNPFFKDELISISFLKDYIISEGPSKIQAINNDAQKIEIKTLSLMCKRSDIDQKVFVIQSLSEMKDHFIVEELNQSGRSQGQGHKGLRLYRSFDRIDQIFELDYQLDKDMLVESDTTERLYQQSGVGVQSGYSTILLALEHLQVKSCSTFVDLGSGYGRVGLVCSLLMPDINFIGYEYVDHRVAVSNNAARFLGLENQLKYVTQDLSLKSFNIPEADIYYLYDPFTEETYRYVLQQIVAVSKKRSVVVVTKGNASSWLTIISDENLWQTPELIDGGNLRIFRS